MPFVATLSACGPLRLLRPRVLEQLTPPVVELVDYLPNVDEPNKAVLARLFATGGLTKARVHRDGVMRASMRIRRDQLIYEPSIIVMPRAGSPGERGSTWLMSVIVISQERSSTTVIPHERSECRDLGGDTGCRYGQVDPDRRCAPAG